MSRHPEPCTATTLAEVLECLDNALEHEGDFDGKETTTITAVINGINVHLRYTYPRHWRKPPTQRVYLDVQLHRDTAGATCARFNGCRPVEAWYAHEDYRWPFWVSEDLYEGGMEAVAEAVLFFSGKG